MPGSLLKALLVVLGTLCVALGVVGIFLPLLPTTVFLLLAAACYAKSSERFYKGLVGHRWLGAYIRQQHGMTRRQKGVTLVVLWVGLGVTMLWSVEALWLHVVLVAIGVGVTIHVAKLPAFRPIPHSAPHDASA